MKTFLLLSAMLLASVVYGQQSTKDELKALKKIDNKSEYIKQTVAKGISYLQRNKIIEANDFFEAAVDKASNRDEKNVVRHTILSKHASCCTSTNQQVNQFIDLLEKAFKKDKRRKLKSKFSSTVQDFNRKVKSIEELSRLYEICTDYFENPNFVKELKRNNGVSQEKNKILSENISILSQNKSIANQKNRLEQEIMLKESAIENLNLTAAKRNLIIQYQKSMLDSIKFVAAIDSLEKLHQQEQLLMQEAKLDLQNSQLQLAKSKSDSLKTIIGMIVAGLLIASFLLYRQITTNRLLTKEKQRSEELLLNILPKEIAEELKVHGSIEPKFYKSGTVLFTDFQNFSKISKQIGTAKLIKSLDECFKEFDRLAAEHNVEKIKTIGDSYMCIGGVPNEDPDSVKNTVEFGLSVQRFLQDWNDQRKRDGKVEFRARVGIHTGPVAAGVVGMKKFTFDTWGDTVNIAARVESKGEIDRVNISQSTYELIKEDYDFIERGKIEAKNVGSINMYFVKA